MVEGATTEEMSTVPLNDIAVAIEVILTGPLNCDNEFNGGVKWLGHLHGWDATPEETLADIAVAIEVILTGPLNCDNEFNKETSTGTAIDLSTHLKVLMQAADSEDELSAIELQGQMNIYMNVAEDSPTKQLDGAAAASDLEGFYGDAVARADEYTPIAYVTIAGTLVANEMLDDTPSNDELLLELVAGPGTQVAIVAGALANIELDFHDFNPNEGEAEALLLTKLNYLAQTAVTVTVYITKYLDATLPVTLLLPDTYVIPSSWRWAGMACAARIEANA
ncbi:hypothetical protein BD779DRAFT_1532961 [Infundibulicybe gibba]|nr:hypothetical protein BD779DRAFT_1532961 [Infundibulicybe gibba]